MSHASVLVALDELKALRADKERLNWIEVQAPDWAWVARQSTTGRGFRLMTIGEGEHVGNPKLVRMSACEAIDAAMEINFMTNEQTEK